MPGVGGRRGDPGEEVFLPVFFIIDCKVVAFLGELVRRMNTRRTKVKKFGTSKYKVGLERGAKNPTVKFPYSA